MGLFSSKIFAGVLVGGFSLLGAGLYFNGTDELNDAEKYVKDASSRLIQYESNENELLAKLSRLKGDANSRIEAANAIIESKDSSIKEKLAAIEVLNEEKATLQNNITALNQTVASLQTALKDAETALNSNTDQLKNLQAQYDAKVSELETLTVQLTKSQNDYKVLQTQYEAKTAELTAANSKINELNQFLQYAYDKAKEGDKHVKELEKELEKANKEVEKLAKVVSSERSKSQDAQPLTQAELNAIDTALKEVKDK